MVTSVALQSIRMLLLAKLSQLADEESVGISELLGQLLFDRVLLSQESDDETNLFP